jgi:hypothetical protein
MKTSCHHCHVNMFHVSIIDNDYRRMIISLRIEARLSSLIFVILLEEEEVEVEGTAVAVLL